MSCYDMIKRNFKRQILKQLQKYRLNNHISLAEVAAGTNIAEERIKRAEIRGKMHWGELATLLLFYNRWIEVRLIDISVSDFAPDEEEDFM